MIAQDAQILLEIGADKKDARVSVGPPTVLPNEMGIYAGFLIPPTHTQTIVGDFRKLLRMAGAVIKDYPLDPQVPDNLILALPSGGSDNDIIVNGTVDTSMVALHIGSDITIGDKTHLLDSMFKTLVDRWLEESK